MYAAIDALADKLERQIIKHKEKVTEHRYDNNEIQQTGTGTSGGAR
jgi:putative sigma-54 modulation protein